VKVTPFDLPIDEIRRSLEVIRRPMRIAVLRSKNPFNVGSIIRVAHSFLAQEIILVGDEPYYKKAAMGMDRYENIVYLPDDDALVSWAKERELPLVGFEREAGQADLWNATMPEACVLLFGSENDGIPESLLKQCDHLVAIPMYGINNSFPITVAAGIAMAEWTRRHYGQRTLSSY
jgi:tRNA G18 (ribose-2'-O)-methylase SpoU